MPQNIVRAHLQAELVLSRVAAQPRGQQGVVAVELLLLEAAVHEHSHDFAILTGGEGGLHKQTGETGGEWKGRSMEPCCRKRCATQPPSKPRGQQGIAAVHFSSLSSKL